MSDQPSINTTSGGVNMGGDHTAIGGDVTGRDKITSIAGDNVQGDKVVNNITHAAQTPTLRATPPRPPDHFTGREADLARFTQLLTAGNNVAITALHGLGGIGKTSLAQKLAEQIADQFPGGVLWWTLGPNPDVITALDVWARHADPHADLTALPTAEARAEAVRPMLAKLGKMCVIIDDVWDAESFNVLRSAVPAGCPLLMTTRDADLAKTLRCRVERIDALSDDEAVDLLVKLLGPLESDQHPERSREAAESKGAHPSTSLRSAQDAYTAAIDIAHLTEGLPLALELIAGLADSPADLPTLAHRLRERSPLDVLKRGTTREQSIETCFTLSYDHLDSDSQRRFCALGVFALAPFDRDAIAAVWAEESEAVDQAISQLVRRSLLSKVDGTDEYRQHALLHDYALKLLKAEENPHPSPPPSETTSDRGGSGTPSPVRGSINADENATSDQRTGERSKTSDASAEAGDGGRLFAARHADYYRTFAQTQHWRAIEHAFDQIEHGWHWVQANAANQIIDYVFAFRGFLQNGGRQTERLNLLKTGLTQARSTKDGTNEGTFLNDIGKAYADVGQLAQALDYYQQALRIYRELGNREFEGITLNNIGLIYKARGQMEEALDIYQRALAISREVGQRSDSGGTLNNIGLIYKARGQMEEALDAYQQALAICREVGNRVGEGTTLNNIGGIYFARGQMGEALGTYQQALIILSEVGNRWNESTLLGNIGMVLLALSHTAEAVTYLEQSVALMEELGHPDLESDRAALEQVRVKLAAS